DGNVFVISAVNGGTLAGKTSGWSNIEILSGGAGGDSFTFTAAGDLTSLDGAGGTDTVSYVGSGAVIDVLMSAVRDGTVTNGGISFTFSNVEDIDGETALANGLTVQNGSVTVTIDAVNGGNTGGAGITFSEFQVITGGTGDDSFV